MINRYKFKSIFSANLVSAICLLIFINLLVISYFYVYMDRNLARRVVESVQFEQYAMLKIPAQGSLSQTFNTAEDAINQVAIKIIDPNPADNKSVHVRIYSKNREITYYENDLISNLIDDDGYLEIDLKHPIKPDQNGISIELSSGTQTSGDLELFTSSENKYPDGEAFFNNKPLVGDISFQLIQRKNLSKFSMLLLLITFNGIAILDYLIFRRKKYDNERS